MTFFCKRRRLSALRFVLMAGFLSVPTVAMGITELRLDCEQQAKRLTRCCGTSQRTTETGGVAPLLRCVEPDGCVGYRDVVDEETIGCLEPLSCDEVQELGLCDHPAECVERRFGGAG